MLAAVRATHQLISLVILVTCFFSIPLTSQACSPAPPDPWFTERISIPPANLPNGVDLRALQITRYGRTRDYVEITNFSATPLYIVGRPWAAQKTFELLPISLPSGIGPTHKVLSQQAFTWGPIFDTPHSHARMGWSEGTIERRDAVLLSISRNRLISDEGDVVKLAPRNQTGDNRPDNIQLPTPQTVQVPFIYGTQMLEAPIVISYTLNLDYKADSVARSLTACGGSGVVVPSIYLIGFVAGGCVGLGWLGYRQWKARHVSYPML